jgi:hypothetical protein
MNDAAYMTCDKMHARIPILTCIGRQTRGVGERQAQKTIPPECGNCAQGSAVRATAGDLAPAPRRQPKKQPESRPERPEGVVDMGTGTWNRKKGCSNCHRDKYVVSGDLCNVCAKAAAGKTGEEREVALAEAKRKLDAGEIKTRKHRDPRTDPPGPLSAPSGKKPAPDARQQRPSEGASAPEGEKCAPNGVKYELVEMLPAPQVVPVTLRLAIEVTIKVNCIQA